MGVVVGENCPNLIQRQAVVVSDFLRRLAEIFAFDDSARSHAVRADGGLAVQSLIVYLYFRAIAPEINVSHACILAALKVSATLFESMRDKKALLRQRGPHRSRNRTIGCFTLTLIRMIYFLAWVDLFDKSGIT